MPSIYVREPLDEEWIRALEWWQALDPGIRMVFLHAVWQIEGCESPDDLEPHQRNPRFFGPQTKDA